LVRGLRGFFSGACVEVWLLLSWSSVTIGLDEDWEKNGFLLVIY
jgi:hypothetical protein